MPGGDGTGPNGMGAMTGRGLGFCSGNERPGYTFAPGAGRGRFGNAGQGMYGSYGRGGGRRGNRNMFYATGLPLWARQNAGPVYPAYGQGVPAYGQGAPAYSRDQEISMLKEDADYYRTMLDDISRRLGELEKDAE